jgi:hypothetical protein
MASAAAGWAMQSANAAGACQLPHPGQKPATERASGVASPLIMLGIHITVAWKRASAGAGQHVLTPCRGRGKPASSRPRTPRTQATRPRRACQPTDQNLRHPAQTRPLPLACRPTRQSHPHPADTQDRRMKTFLNRPGRQFVRSSRLRAASFRHQPSSITTVCRSNNSCSKL